MRRFVVRVISRKKLREAGEQHSEWKSSLEAWFRIAKAADWRHFLDVRQTLGSADSVGSCVVFNIGGNKCRLITRINYKYRVIYTLHVLDHAEYDIGRWKDDCNCD